MIVRIAIISDNLSIRDFISMGFINYIANGKSNNEIYSGTTSKHIQVRTRSPILDSIGDDKKFLIETIDRYLLDQGRRSSDKVISERMEQEMYESDDIYYVLYPYTPMDLFLRLERMEMFRNMLADEGIQEEEESRVYLERAINVIYDWVVGQMKDRGIDSYDIIDRYMSKLKFHSVLGIFSDSVMSNKYSILGLSMAQKNNFYYGGNMESNSLYIPKKEGEKIKWVVKEFVNDEMTKEKRIEIHLENYIENTLPSHLKYWIEELSPH